MGTFKPHMEVPPASQQKPWPEPRVAADLGFVLYGGRLLRCALATGIPLISAFFSEKPLDRNALQAAFPLIEQSIVLQDRPGALSILVPCGDSERKHVKVSFFRTIGFGRVGEPDFTHDGVLYVASLDDLGDESKCHPSAHRSQRLSGCCGDDQGRC
jgi:hypothetical protein